MDFWELLWCHFYRPDTFPLVKPRASEHRMMMTVFLSWTACCHHAVLVSQEHCYGSTFYVPDSLPVAQPCYSTERLVSNMSWHITVILLIVLFLLFITVLLTVLPYC